MSTVTVRGGGMTPLYYWEGREVKTGHYTTNSYDKYAVDTEYEIPNQRYGMYMRHGGWRPIPIEIFPPEFRVHLLLLGVA